MNIDALEAMLARGQDSAMLRLTLGNAYAKAGDSERAESHLRAAVTQDAGYSAAWRALGRLQQKAGELDAAAESYRQGLTAARERGDMQIVRELEVRLRRLEREG
ncbi:tetratricopeptide repeat protein [Arhodomonas sp. AD133]|uniref:tetratricopeptide repeat protein n=1 Tax=Arhodomonas sp. AD133 TaxID=3415009 RepID=UPI003EB9076F